MHYSPLEHMDSLRIGTVEFVSPDEIKVALEIDTPDSIALNTGQPSPFPRVNGYVLIPTDGVLLVAQVNWITVERSPYPKRRGMQDFGLVDLPYPLRKMSLNPLGTLYAIPGLPNAEINANESSRCPTQAEKVAEMPQTVVQEYRFRRGTDTLPSIGAAALLPTSHQLQSILRCGLKRRVRIGTSMQAGNADVYVDPDRLFGRHLAVLGNTGSGKSCSVAGLIRWSLEAATQQDGSPNARFIILDPNGEYSNAFVGLNAKVFKINPADPEIPLSVPLWFWNSVEWAAFVQASSKTQKPTLSYALSAVREGLSSTPENASHDMRRFLRTLVTIVQGERSLGTPWASFPKPKSFFEKIEKWRKGLEPADVFSASEKKALAELNHCLDGLIQARKKTYPHYDFERSEVYELQEKIQAAHFAFGGDQTDLWPIDADVPREFDSASFLKCLDASAEMLDVTEYVETMLIRIRALLNNSHIRPIIDTEIPITLDGWLSEYLGTGQEGSGGITVIDLSLVPAEVIHIITAVIARMIFEALQRYRKLHPDQKVFPTVLVMEEAHNFIKRYNDIETSEAMIACCQVFERIAREGRKFGLGLVLSSQRPYELSPTVLSQCNTFLLHRISNDRDQDLVERLVPDNLKGLLRELPSLPSQNAILLGWASEIPVLVRMNDLSEQQRPQSHDPDFWTVWTGQEKRVVDWRKIADDWQQKPIKIETMNAGSELPSPVNNDGLS